jgi:hypothetical protein
VGDAKLGLHAKRNAKSLYYDNIMTLLVVFQEKAGVSAALELVRSVVDADLAIEAACCRLA